MLTENLGAMANSRYNGFREIMDRYVLELHCIWFNGPSGFREDFWRVFTIYGHGSHLGHVTWTPWTNFHSPIPWRLHMKFGFNQPSGFGEEDVWKCWQTYRQRPCHMISSPMSLRFRWAKNPKKITQILRKVIGSVIKKGFPGEGNVADSTHFRTLLFSYNVCSMDTDSRSPVFAITDWP